VAPIRQNLVALGSAAVLSIYAAGYARTRAAAHRFAVEAHERRTPSPAIEPAARHAAQPTPSPEATPAAVRADAHPSPPSEGVGEVRSSSAVAAKPALPKHAPPARDADAPAAAKPRLDSLPTQRVANLPISASPALPPRNKDSLTRVPVAPAATVADTASQSPDKDQAPYKDGTYTGWGTSRHGDIQATVMIKDGRIAGAVISECLTRYSCSWIAALPGQVAARQSAEVDFVSGATESSNAFYYAVVDALKKTK
jgi:uncharacterized protein with FMN-binding domain